MVQNTFLNKLARQVFLQITHNCILKSYTHASFLWRLKKQYKWLLFPWSTWSKESTLIWKLSEKLKKGFYTTSKVWVWTDCFCNIQPRCWLYMAIKLTVLCIFPICFQHKWQKQLPKNRTDLTGWRLGLQNDFSFWVMDYSEETNILIIGNISPAFVKEEAVILFCHQRSSCLLHNNSK